MVLEVWTDLADEILASGTWEARSVFRLAWSPVSTPCAVRGPSSGWLMPLCLGPELMDVNIQARPTVDNVIQMACSPGQRNPRSLLWMSSNQWQMGQCRNERSELGSYTAKVSCYFCVPTFSQLQIYTQLWHERNVFPILFTSSSPGLSRSHHFYCVTFTTNSANSIITLLFILIPQSIRAA